MHDLTISGVQCNLKWQDKQYNLDHIQSMIARSELKNTNIIILPEMFSTGFSMDAELLAETMDGPTIRWMFKQSLQSDSAICGSIIIFTRPN